MCYVELKFEFVVVCLFSSISLAGSQFSTAVDGTREGSACRETK